MEIVIVIVIVIVIGWGTWFFFGIMSDSKKKKDKEREKKALEAKKKNVKKRKKKPLKPRLINFKYEYELEDLPIIALSALKRQKKSIAHLNQIINFEIVDTKLLERLTGKFEPDRSRSELPDFNFIVKPTNPKFDFYFAVSKLFVHQDGTMHVNVFYKPSSKRSNLANKIKIKSITDISDKFIYWRDLVLEYHYLIFDLADNIPIFDAQNDIEYFDESEVLRLNNFINDFSNRLDDLKTAENSSLIEQEQTNLNEIRTNLKNSKKSEVKSKLERTFNSLKKIGYDVMIKLIVEVAKQYFNPYLPD